MKRRNLIKELAIVPLAGGLIASSFPFQSFANRQTPGRTKQSGSNTQEASGVTSNSIYDSIGVRSVINGRGTVTIIGASRMLPEVEKTMRAATGHYVQLDELMEGAAKRLAELTGAEWGIVTTGATGALIVGCAGIVTGGNPDKLWQLPNLEGMKNEVIIPRYSWTAYESAVRGVGVKLIEVATPDQLKAAVNDKTAMVLVLAGEQSENGPLSTRIISSIVKSLNIPILVDAAAEGLSLPNPHLSQGADLVAYSGGKYLSGPQCAGLLLGRKDLVKAAWVTSAPHHGYGRGYKVGREEIMGMLTAVEMWFKRDHAAEMLKWNNWLNNIASRLKDIPGVVIEIRQPLGRSNPSPDLLVKWDTSLIPLSGYDVENLLWDDNPRVAVSGAGSFLPFPPNMQPNISINSSQLEEGEEKIIAERVFNVLSKPPVINKNLSSPAFDVSGDWSLEMKFVAGRAKQKLALKQSGKDLSGIHTASYAPRSLTGHLNGNNILIRSAYTTQGVRLSFEFTGVVKANEMEGHVIMGEYGMAEWKAVREK
ncbi:MAG: aminotransferase class V-fold PLP-dependent enzyme [Ginsengibacter sp.]